jgi:signal peptidase I
VEPTLPTPPLWVWIRRLRRILTYLIILAFVWLIFQFGTYKIPRDNDSMRGLYPPGTSLLYDRLFAYHNGAVPFFGVKNHGIESENIVIFVKKGVVGINRKTGQEEKMDFKGISRVIALPGEEIEFSEGRIVVGTRVCFAKHSHKAGKEKVPQDHFFVLNENTASNFYDSRDFGYLKAEEIVGAVIGPMKLW